MKEGNDHFSIIVLLFIHSRIISKCVSDYHQQSAVKIAVVLNK